MRTVIIVEVLTAEHGQDFLVTTTAGPMADGELDRARHWAQSLTG